MVSATAPLIGFSGEIIWSLGENITTGEDWRRGTFNPSFDELCDSKIIISIQRNHWKTGSQEHTSSSVNGSRNV
ncbi:hypothetical protein Tco_1472202, partial [Tanacetum coccineum]